MVSKKRQRKKKVYRRGELSYTSPDVVDAVPGIYHKIACNRLRKWAIGELSHEKLFAPYSKRSSGNAKKRDLVAKRAGGSWQGLSDKPRRHNLKDIPELTPQEVVLYA